MTKSEVSFLLSAIYVYERRQDAVSTVQVEAWHQLLGDIDFETAKKVIASHYMESDRTLTVAGLRAAARSLQPRRDTVDEKTRVPDADPDDTRAFIGALKSGHWQPPRDPEDYETKALDVSSVGRRVPQVSDKEVGDDEPRPRRWWMSRWGNKTDQE